ncbi:hypothetical protein HMPREF8579_0617 [Streptococcus oralis ATCC 35037]|nr:hypothetical protein HMPREF8579_0617 [Streptococcus oralis ATCC 35037]
MQNGIWNFAYILEQLKRTKANENAENSKDGWNFHHDCDIIFITINVYRGLS